ncbi:MAG: hypothetical protein VCB79_00605, partial [Dehalococcoidia bacterium]
PEIPAITVQSSMLSSGLLKKNPTAQQTQRRRFEQRNSGVFCRCRVGLRWRVRGSVRKVE